MNPEEIRNWASIILGIIATLGVAIIGGRAAWKNSRKTAAEQAEARKEPSWKELVDENRDLRTELTDLRDAFDTHRENQEKLNKEQSRKVESLEVDRKLSDRRETLLYFHTKALRDHILNEMPPPPPAAPPELVDWFESFEDTMPPGLA